MSRSTRRCEAVRRSSKATLFSIKILGFAISSYRAFLTSQVSPRRSWPVKSMICAICFVGTRRDFNSVKSLVLIDWSASSTLSFFSSPSSSKGSPNSISRLGSSSDSSTMLAGVSLDCCFPLATFRFFFLPESLFVCLAMSSFSALSRFLAFMF